ncbi:hypothetical protein RJ640_006564 [Escallonia rubra]|uniref:Myb/SANT-like domain-containing protein n=1 Tax=Escallonia rubra TaxID=112253 RepID=A0AA88RSJ8_9ASTE|nr:hypothetical protein RJ640_006564 [Escallonia rubra]
MAIVERLEDFKQGERSRSPRHKCFKYGGDGRSKSGSPKATDDEWSGDKGRCRHHKEEKKHEGSHKRGDSCDHKAHVGPRGGCFYCAGPHYIRNCPLKGKMIAFLEKHKCSNEDSSNSDGEARMGALQMVNTFAELRFVELPELINDYIQNKNVDHYAIGNRLENKPHIFYGRSVVVGATAVAGDEGSYFGVEDEEFEEDGLEGGVCSSVGEVRRISGRELDMVTEEQTDLDGDAITIVETSDQWTEWRDNLANEIMASSKNKGKATSKDKGNRRVWTTIEEQTFLDIMEDCVKEGRKQETGFKPGTFSHIEKQMEEKLPGCNLLATPHIESKYKGLKRMYYVVTDMLGSSGFGWNETLHSIESHPEAKGLLNKPLFKYDQLGFIFGKDRATGKSAEAPGDAVEDLDREEGTIGLDDMDMSATSKRMEMLAKRLGHAKDAPLDRKKVYEELCRIDFASELDRLQVTHKIAAKHEIVDVFLCLPDDAKASYAHMLLNTDV